MPSIDYVHYGRTRSPYKAFMLKSYMGYVREGMLGLLEYMLAINDDRAKAPEIA